MPGAFKTRLDSFYNAITRLGGMTDKRAGAVFGAGVLLNDTTLDNLYHFNDLAAIICDTYPQEALRMGFSFHVPDDLEAANDINNRIEVLNVKAVLQDCAVWSRVFGDACVFMGVDDGQKVDRPLDYARIRPDGLRYLSVYDKRDFTIDSYYNDPLSPKFNTPEYFTLTRVSTIRGLPATGVGIGVRIHESRLVWIHGTRTSRQKLSENNGWHFSALQRPYEVIRDFEMTWAAASHLLSEAGHGVYKVKNLLEILSSKDGAGSLETRMAAIDAGRSVARSIVVDADGEDYTRQPANFGSIPDMLDRFAGRLAATAGIPVTRLMGEAPAGLGATGASDTRFFYDRVENYRTDDLQPGLERILKVVLYTARPGTTEDTEPEWSVEWPSLYVSTEKEKADIRKVVADTDSVYVNMGAVTPEEVALSRFGEGGWSMDTVVNLDVRNESADALTVDDIRPPVVEPDPNAPPAEKDTDNVVTD